MLNAATVPTPPGFYQRWRWGKDETRHPLSVPSYEKWSVQVAWRFSTGAKTAEGIERIRRAVTKHGRYSQRAIAERRQDRMLALNFREMLRGI